MEGIIDLLGYEFINNKKADSIVVLHGFGGDSYCFEKQFKVLSKHFNLVLIYLNGHGLSKNFPLYKQAKQTFEFIAEEVLKVLDKLKIEKAHFIALSLGTMVLHTIAYLKPEKVKSMVMAGAVFKYNLLGKILITVGNGLKYFVSHNFMYSFFASIMIPRKNHEKSRKIFVREAKKLDTKEFYAWFKLVQKFPKEYTFNKIKKIKTPKLYIMGEYDHMFIKFVKKYSLFDKKAQFNIIENAGHVCNIDNVDKFNEVISKFYRKIKKCS